VPAIDEALLDEIPGPQGRGEEALLAGDLIGIQEPDDRLGLRPPLLVGVGQAVRPALVVQPAVGVDALGQRRFGNLDRQGPDAPDKLFIPSASAAQVRSQAASMSWP
jgi:hypothetical protein